jgi:hypothetical protein
MAYRGWLSYAGQEIVNEARVRAYVQEMVPGLDMPKDCHDGDDLAASLGDKPYSLPAIDDAPWFDPDDGDTGGFCGVLPLTVSGLTDSTRDITSVEHTADGGSVIGQRRRSREIRVTGLLIGVDNAAVAAGKTWLKAALDGTCANPCEPSDLCFLAAPPNLDVAMGDYTKDPVPVSLLRGPSGLFNASTGVFSPSASTQTLDTPGAPQPLPCDEIRWEWQVQGDAGTVVVVETVGEKGLTSTGTFILTGAVQSLTVSDKGESEKKSYSRLRVSTASESVTVSAVTIEYRLPGDPSLCFDKYLRQLRKVTCIDGPTTTREYAPSNGAMELVEFSFHVGVPWIYGVERDVVTLDGSRVTATMPGATGFPMDRTIPVCAAKRARTLVMDPDCPPIPAPPRAASPTSACLKDPEWYEPWALSIPQEAIPLWTDTVPILTIRTGGTAARKVIVRFMPRPLSTQAPEDLDPCSACGQFVIDYIPPNAAFILNGMDERAYIRQSGNVLTSGDHLLSGPTSDQLFEWPLMSCGSGYLVILDVASATIAGFDLSIAVRE